MAKREASISNCAVVCDPFYLACVCVQGMSRAVSYILSTFGSPLVLLLLAAAASVRQANERQDMVDGFKKCVFVCVAHYIEDFLQRLPNVLVRSPSESGQGALM